MKKFIFLVIVLGSFGLIFPVTQVFATHTIFSISPNTGELGDSFFINVRGIGFGGGVMPVSISGAGVTVSSPTTPGTPADERMSFQVTIAATAPLGARTLTFGTVANNATAQFTVVAVGGGGGVGEIPRERIPKNVTSANQFIDLLDNIVDWIFVIVLVGSVVFIVLAGWQFISGGGEPQAMSQARNKLLYAAIGIAVAVLSRGIVTAVRSLIGT